MKRRHLCDSFLFVAQHCLLFRFFVAATFSPLREGLTMLPKKTIQEREKELQVLLADPAGRKELALLESRYSAASGRIRSQRASIITYILVCERERGLIGN